jgi:hypothetical protein
MGEEMGLKDNHGGKWSRFVPHTHLEMRDPGDEGREQLVGEDC